MKDISPKIVQDTLICNEIYSADCSLKDLDTYDMPEVGIVTHGSGVHRIINRAIPCKSGDIFILNSGVPHKYFANNDEDAPKVLTIRFDPEEWFGGSESGMGCYGVFSESSIVAYAMLNSKTKAEVIELYKKTVIEFFSITIFSHCSLYAIFSLILRLFHSVLIQANRYFLLISR